MFKKICTEELKINQSTESQSLLCRNNTMYCGNIKDFFVVGSLWIAYVLLISYFAAAVSPYYWVNYNPVITIFGILLGIPGLYNAIKCFSTDPGIIKRPTNEEMIEIRRQCLNYQLEMQKQELNQQMNEINIQNKENDSNKQELTGQQQGQNDVNQVSIPIPEFNSPQQDNIHSPESQQHQQLQENPDISLDSSRKENQQILHQSQPSQQNQDVSQAEQNALDIKINLDTGYNQENVIQQKLIQQLQTQQTITHQPGDLYKERYCPTCCVFRPPLASHCSRCNNCVRGYDHHCSFMGNCVGERNHRNFLLFLLFTSLACLFYFFCCLGSFIENIQDNWVVFQDFYKCSDIFYTFIGAFGLCILGSFTRSSKIEAFTMGCFVIMLIVSFFWILTESNISYYENPVIPIAGMSFYGSSMMMVLPQMVFHCFLACIDSTVKEQEFIRRTSLPLKKCSLKGGIFVFYKFLTQKHPPSEILRSQQ